MAIEHADFEGVERLAAVTGGATASTFDHPELAVLGECAKIEEVRIFSMKNAAYGRMVISEHFSKGWLSSILTTEVYYLD